MTKLLLVVAYTGFQPIEYTVPKKLLENAGFTVMTASNKAGTATATDGSTTTVDTVISDVNVDDYDGIFFVGGSGALENLDNQTNYDLINKAISAKKAVGAICISTRILAKAGVLKGRHATGWDGDNELAAIYKEHGVNYVRRDVVTDNKIITATGPKVAHEFGQHIISLLQ